MGTRADFYLGKNEKAEWLGSIAWDGYRSGIPEEILKADTETRFLDAVKSFLKEREDATTPDMGWPWPWDDSSVTDCSYWFFEGQLWEEYDGVYRSCGKEPEPISFPKMKHGEPSAATGSFRSGIMMFGSNQCQEQDESGQPPEVD